jgi:hypothetical protein
MRQYEGKEVDVTILRGEKELHKLVKVGSSQN